VQNAHLWPCRRVIMAAILSTLASPVAFAQLTDTVSTVASGHCVNYQGPYWSESEYSNWNYKDASGTSHSFPGDTLYEVRTPYTCGDGGHTCYCGVNIATRLGTPSTDLQYYLSATGPSGTVTKGLTGWVNPKYKILGVVYSVPGQPGNPAGVSFVEYSSTSMMGTSTSTSSSFSTAVASSIEICGGAGVGASNGTSVCGTYSTGFSQESGTSSSFELDQTTTFTNIWYPLTGPLLNHSNDVIYVWVNPQVWYTVYPTSPTGPTPLYWNGYTYDEVDDSNNMEVIPIRLSQLLNPSTIDSYIQGRLKRAWAPNNTDGSGPAITNQDLLNIAAADPFSNPNYTVTIGSDGKTTTDGRFTQTTNNPMFYVPGGNYTYQWGYTATDTQGQSAKTINSQAFAIEVKNSADWIAHISFDWKSSTTFTWTDQWSTLMTQKTGELNTVSIIGPTVASPPDEFNVFEDNVYGTFMVWPVPGQ